VILDHNGVGIRIDTTGTNLIIRNALITGGGTGLWVSNASPVIESCTIATNTANGLDYVSGSPTIRNCIFWDNGDDLLGSLGPGMISYCDTRDGDFSGQNGCISANPRFKGVNNFRLDRSSPCANAGTNIRSWMTTAVDLAGRRRIQTGRVDLGAYEMSSSGTALVRR